MFRFWLDIPGQGRVRCYPRNAELKWVDSKKKGFRFYQRTLETNLVFMDEPAAGIYDFQRLMDLERQGKTCERVEVYVDRYCDCTDSWTAEWWKGYLRLSRGTWDVSNCTVTIGVDVNDAYTCLTTNWDKTFNIFDYGGDPVEVEPFYGVIQYETCEYTKRLEWQPPISVQDVINAANDYFTSNPANDCIDTSEGWSTAKRAYIGDIEVVTFPPAKIFVDLTVRYKWVREFSADVAEPPGGGWIAVTGGWARPVDTVPGTMYDHVSPEGYQLLQDEFGGTSNFGCGLYQENTVVGLDANGNSLLTNGRSMSTIIENWLEDCDLTVASDFFGINPDGTAPDNSYYTAAETDAQGIVLYQVTDIARTDETESAKRGETTFKKLLNALKVAFNIDVEITGNVLRIEHQSYWSRDVNMDLTQEPFIRRIKDKWRYTYDSAKLPQRELFFWGAETDRRGGVFDGWPIEYDNACVNDIDEPVEESYRADGYITNVGKVVDNEDFFDSELIVMVSTSGGVANYAEVTTTVIINLPIAGIYYEIPVTRSYLNGNMGFTELLPTYHPYGRPFRTGFINQTETAMVQSLRQRQQADFTIPMQCDDYMTHWDAAGLVKTQMGAGEVEKATYTDPTGELTLTLKHK